MKTKHKMPAPCIKPLNQTSDRETSRRTLRKRLHKMNYIVSHMPTSRSSMMLEVVRNQRAIMNFLLTHVTGEKV